jgi:two-component system response regulator
LQTQFQGGIKIAEESRGATRPSSSCNNPAPIRILLAEDNPGDVQLLTVLLEMSGLPVSLKHVTDGEKALSYLKGIDDAELPDVILLDLRMPRMDGFDFLKERKKDPRISSVLTVVLTSSNAPRDRRMAMDLGADLFMLKPDRMEEAEELIPSLERFIRQRLEPQTG